MKPEFEIVFLIQDLRVVKAKAGVFLSPFSQLVLAISLILHIIGARSIFFVDLLSRKINEGI